MLTFARGLCLLISAAALLGCSTNGSTSKKPDVSIAKTDDKDPTGKSPDKNVQPGAKVEVRDAWVRILPVAPAYSLPGVIGLKHPLMIEELKTAGMSEKFIKQFQEQLSLAIKAAEDGKFETSIHEDASFAVITHRVHDMLSAAQWKKSSALIKADLKKLGASEKFIAQFDTQIDRAITAAIEGRFSILEHRDESFSVIFWRVNKATGKN
jgi:hypothetical protein